MSKQLRDEDVALIMVEYVAVLMEETYVAMAPYLQVVVATKRAQLQNMEHKDQ